MSFLVDTGAVHSFVRSEFADHPDFRDEYKDLRYYMANNDSFSVLGTIRFSVVIEDKEYKKRFLVANVVTNLLGFDFLRKYNMVLLHNPLRLRGAQHLTISQDVVSNPNPTQVPLGRELPAGVPRECFVVRNPAELSHVRDDVATRRTCMMAKLREKFPYLFGEPNLPARKPLKSHGVEMTIELTGTYLPRYHYPVPGHYKERVEVILREMLTAGVSKSRKEVNIPRLSL